MVVPISLGLRFATENTEDTETGLMWSPMKTMSFFTPFRISMRFNAGLGEMFHELALEPFAALKGKLAKGST